MRVFFSRRWAFRVCHPEFYFRALLVGYFEGIDSERGIAWRMADSLSFAALSGF